MKILDFSLTRLRNEEHFQFQTTFKDLVLNNVASSLRIKALLSTYLPLYDNEMEALDVIRKNSISDDLVDADGERDRVFRGMCDAVKSGLNHFNPDVRQAAQRLWTVLSTYGNLAGKSYDAETAAINSLVADLQGKWAADVTTLGIGAWIPELAAKNKAFDDLKNNRYTQEANKTSFRMKEERLKVDAAYRQIVELINSLIVVEGDAAYASFVNELNKRIEAFDNTVSMRRGKSKKTTDSEK